MNIKKVIHLPLGSVLRSCVSALIGLFILASLVNCNSIIANGKENLNASPNLIRIGAFPSAHDSEPVFSTFTWTSIDVTQPNMQGDAHLLEPPDGTKILVDAGSVQGAPKLINFLRERKIERLHKVLITHPHVDHLEGIVPLLQAGIKVDEIYLNFYTPDLWDHWGVTPQMINKVQETLKHFKLEVRPIIPGLILYRNEKEKLKIEVLYQFTPENIPTAQPHLNDLSSLVLITHHRLKFLLAGDISKGMGAWYADQGNLTVDVLKVPHHGVSLAAPSFYAAVGAKTFVIPAPVSLWENKRRCAALYQVLQADPSIKTLVNGRDGHIRISSNGYSFQIKRGN